MIADSLKKALLQAAIQGKLTEQLPEDGDARDLLKEIQKEKARLVKEGKIKKEKPLLEIKEDEIPFDIPENWVWIRMGDVVQLVSGTSFSKNDTNEDDIRIIRGGNIDDTSNELLLLDDDTYVSGRLYDKEKEPAIGDIIIVGSTGSKKVIGKPAFVEHIYENVQIGAFLRIIRPTFSFLRDFLKIIFRSEHYRQHIRDLAQGTNINNVKTSYLTEFIIPFPPLSEQERIVQKLETFLQEIESLKEEEIKLNNLEKGFPVKIRASILQAAIQGKLTEQLPEDGDARDLLKEIQKEKDRLIKEGKIRKEKPLPEITEDEIPFEIPDNWVWCYLSSVTTLVSSKPFQIFEKEILSEGLYPVVSQGKKLIEGYSNWQEKLLIHKKPIILFGDHTKNLKLIDFDFIVGADGTKLLQPIGILPEYLFRNLEYNVLSIGTRNYGRHFSLLSSAPIAIPPIEEQKRIVDKLEDLLPLCDALD